MILSGLKVVFIRAIPFKRVFWAPENLKCKEGNLLCKDICISGATYVLIKQDFEQSAQFWSLREEFEKNKQTNKKNRLSCCLGQVKIVEHELRFQAHLSKRL